LVGKDITGFQTLLSSSLQTTASDKKMLLKKLREKLNETIFSTRRQPGIGKFFNNAKGKIGKQSIQNRLKFMDERRTDWLGMEMDNAARRRLL